MSVLLTTPPALEPVTLAEAKAHLRVTHSDDDTYISTLIKTARLSIETQTGLALIQQGWSVFLDDWPDSGVITLPLRPIIDVADIKTYGDDNTPATIDPAHYYEDRTATPARIVLRGSRSWVRPGRVANGIEILVLAGFGTTATAVPEPLREALLQLIGHWFGTRGDAEAGDLPLMVRQLLQPYRRIQL
jgi:uncharacterized phiE125 gp8 family phage protein